MSWLATVVLCVTTLVHLNLPISWQNKLESEIIPNRGSHELVSLLLHPKLASPVKTGANTLALSAGSSLAWDMDTATILHQTNPQRKMPIASITKLVTVLVILRDHKLDETITVPTLPAYSPEEVTLGLVPGQKFLLKDLLAAALIPSANDAADTLAIYNSKTKEAFSAKMNRLVEEWGISGVHFSNPSGLSDVDNYATADAVAKIASLVLTNSTVSTLVKTPTMTIHDSAGKAYPLQNTDQLLSDKRVQGVKTGFTGAAGQCFVALAVINGHRVITVVLNSPDRFAETTTLINYLESNYSWQQTTQ